MCDIHILSPVATASLLYMERACSPFIPNFQHHVLLLSCTNTDTDKTQNSNVQHIWQSSSTLSHSWSSVIPKRKRNKETLAQTLASYSSQHPCEVGRKTSPFPATGDKAENTADIPQGSKWRTRKAGNQEFLAPNSSIQKPRCWTPRHYQVISLFIAMCYWQQWLLCVCQQSEIQWQKQLYTWSCPQTLLLYFTDV